MISKENFRIFFPKKYIAQMRPIFFGNLRSVAEGNTYVLIGLIVGLMIDTSEVVVIQLHNEYLVDYFNIVRNIPIDLIV